MLSSRQFSEYMDQHKKQTLSLFMVMIMIVTSLLTYTVAISENIEPETSIVDEERMSYTSMQLTQQGQGQLTPQEIMLMRPDDHPAAWDIMWNDPAVMQGKVIDYAALDLDLPLIYGLAEEPRRTDHDNDGIDDLNDNDDDNDGILDLLERFDGCFGTDPYDHDNDGLLDHLDYDDDNDGILEGPIDYTRPGQTTDSDNDGYPDEDPMNVSMDRYVVPSTIHPLTNQPVGPNYRVDQLPFDHDNDGVPDEDTDGSASGSYDEDDDNDGRIDQFKWPCDFDGDGAQDYFDDDDDNDGILDLDDEHPYDATLSDDISSTASLYSAAIVWSFSDYRDFSAGINFVQMEADRVDAADTFDWAGGTDGDGASGTPAFDTIVDGDLDNDGSPNFLDPDNDNDETPDSADNDDDNDGLLDMWDPDDDNDGIPDVCWNVDINLDGLNDYTRLNQTPYQIPGKDGDGDGNIDCEIDYDQDLDDDRWRAFDQNYNGIWDWKDPDMGGTLFPDDEASTNQQGLNFSYDMDNDQIQNENDSFPLNSTVETNTWNCPTLSNPVPANPDPRCTTMRASFASFNDWDGDGISNWDDVDDDGDGIMDILDIDWDCDFDNDADLHDIDGSKYRDDGPNNLDTDIDGDGLSNDIDWDDDNDGLNDLFDPDDGNCGVVDYDQSDSFYKFYYPLEDGEVLDGMLDSQNYQDGYDAYWNMIFMTNPFAEVGLNYNGFDPTTPQVTNGEVPEFYWFLFARWSSYNGGNDWDIDADGDSLINGLDVDQDADGLPDWWDQDEGNDGIMDVDDIKFGGTFNMTSCGWVAGNLGQGYTCGYTYALAYHMPLNGVRAQIGSPYSTRPDAVINQGPLVSDNIDYSCTPGAQGGCWHYFFDNDPNQPVSALPYVDMVDNRDAFLTWLGIILNVWQWQADSATGETSFPDELGADLIKNDVDGDVDGDFTNNTIDIDEDYDGVYDWADVDDDNDGLWDFFEIDSDDDLDNDANQNNGLTSSGLPQFFGGENCVDNDDDGNDADIDGNGFYQPVWDRGILSQGLRSPSYYDVDNDNDGVPDAEDWDDDNNNLSDAEQELIPGCFWGEEQSPFDYDNDGVPNWMDDDFDGDGLSNTEELNSAGLTSVFDHDNDGLRDDLDKDDDEDGMEDKDEVLLWPTRFDRNSTNPWDHDDFGDGEAMANPSDPFTGPDGIDIDDDWDGWEDLDHDHLEEGEECTLLGGSTQPASDWDHDNDCLADKDDKAPTFITLETPDTLWLDAKQPALFSGHVDWINPNNPGQPEPAPNLPVQVHIEWAKNNTTAVETIDVLTNAGGNFTVGQFLFPEDLHVGDNNTYRVYAEVTEMFAFNGAKSIEYSVGCKANLTARVSDVWEYFRSDEQPFWLEFYSLYTADYERGIFNNRLRYVPMTFEITGGLFGNITAPTNFTGPFAGGYRTDGVGLATLAFNQSSGATGSWTQIQYNSTYDNGPLAIPGAFEEIIWDNTSKQHQVKTGPDGNATVFDLFATNTSLPAGDIQIIGFAAPELAGEWPEKSGLEWPFPHLVGSATDPQNMRVMHRMNINGEMALEAISPVYYWDASINNFDGTFGSWATIFHEPALIAAGLSFNDVKQFKPYPSLWDGDPETLTGEKANLRGFLSANATHWFIKMVNGGDSDLPPCGPVNPDDPNSIIRCEIVPEMNTGTTFTMTGEVSNRTLDPWTTDKIALQIDVDRNLEFAGAAETSFVEAPKCYGAQGNLIQMTPGGGGEVDECISKGGVESTYGYNFTWTSQYAAGTFGIRVDFTNGAYYFTGNTSDLAQTGAYINVTVVGTTEFQMQSVPRLYRNSTTTINAKLIDNALQPMRDVPVNWTWSADGRKGVNITDSNGVVQIPFEVNASDDLGNYTLTFQYSGTSLYKGASKAQSIWVVSRTIMKVIGTDSTKEGQDNLFRSGDKWDFTAQIYDDNRTIERDYGGASLEGSESPAGGLVDVIYEGLDFDGKYHRQLVATLSPNGGSISLPEKQADDSHLCFYDGNNDGIPDRDTNGDGLSRDEKIDCLQADVNPLSPSLLRKDPDSFLPDGFGPVNVILRFEENLPNEGCEALNIETLNFQNSKWDPCLDLIGNDHYRIVMSHTSTGFALLGETEIEPFKETVYTSETLPDGTVITKDMNVKGRLFAKIDESTQVNLTSRQIFVEFRMASGGDVINCGAGTTDNDGLFDIMCPLEGISSGEALVSIKYSADANGDSYRYLNTSLPDEKYIIFSNSTLQVTEVGPYRNSVENYISNQNGTSFYVLYLKESFHINAQLAQANGLSPRYSRCLNIYMDPEITSIPIGTAKTNERDGTIEWYSSNPDDNPDLLGVEIIGGKMEGFRTLRLAYEPDKKVTKGCDKDSYDDLNGTYIDLQILVRSKVDLSLKESWANTGEGGLIEGDEISGKVGLLRQRMDRTVENQEVWFIREYWDSTTNEWVRSEGRNESITNEQGIAEFSWSFAGQTCDGDPCSGLWRIIAYYPGSTLFTESADNITLELRYEPRIIVDNAAGFFTPSNIMGTIILLMAALIAGIMYYRRTSARRQVEALRGILTDTMLQLQAANEYIAIIFDCYKQLVKHFRRYGFMKKVYETTREFESAVKKAFYMLPADQLADFLTVFEEARYSDHNIGVEHRDRAIATLGSITQSLTMALGETGLVSRTEEHNAALYDQLTKAGEFKTADGTVIQAGLDENAEDSGFKI